MKKNLLAFLVGMLALCTSFPISAQEILDLSSFNEAYPATACDTLRADQYSAPDWTPDRFYGYAFNANNYPTRISTYLDDASLEAEWRITRNSSDLVTQADLYVMYPGSLGLLKEKTYTLTYNGSNQLIGQVSQELTGLPATYTNLARNIYTYNTDGTLATLNIESWNATNSAWENYVLYTYKYDGSQRLGNVETFWYQSSELYRTSYTYNDGKVSSEIYQKHIMGQTYEDISKKAYSYNDDGDLQRTLRQQYTQGIGWEDVQLDSTRAHNQFQTWMWNKSNNTWMNARRQVCAIGGGFPPLAPKSLSATAKSNSRIDLTWTDASADEEGFVLQRSEDAGGTWITVDSIALNTTAFSDMGLEPSTTYAYRIASYNAAGKSPWSDMAIAVTLSPGNAPDDPSGLYITKFGDGNDIRLIWTDNSFGSSQATGFNIYRSENNVSWKLAGSTDKTFFDDSDLPQGMYYYRVSAYNNDGESGYSNTDSVEILVTGIEAHTANHIVSAVYPNPATDLLTIQLTATGNTQIRVMDLAGKIILTQNGVNQQSATLDLSNMASGSYILEVRSATEIYTQKLIVK